MVETYRATSKINKQQINNISSRTKRQIIMGRKIHKHKHTLKTNSLTCRWQTVKLQRVTSDIKADRQTSKEHLGKYCGKTHQEKKEQHENRSAPHCASCCTIMKHGCNKNIRRPQCHIGSERLSQYKNLIIKVHRYANYEPFKSIKQKAHSVQTHSKS